jgi:hypothetical protein
VTDGLIVFRSATAEQLNMTLRAGDFLTCSSGRLGLAVSRGRSKKKLVNCAQRLPRLRAAVNVLVCKAHSRVRLEDWGRPASPLSNTVCSQSDPPPQHTQIATAFSPRRSAALGSNSRHSANQIFSPPKDIFPFVIQVLIMTMSGFAIRMGSPLA